MSSLSNFEYKVGDRIKATVQGRLQKFELLEEWNVGFFIAIHCKTGVLTILYTKSKPGWVSTIECTDYFYASHYQPEQTLDEYLASMK